MTSGEERGKGMPVVFPKSRYILRWRPYPPLPRSRNCVLLIFVLRTFHGFVLERWPRGRGQRACPSFFSNFTYISRWRPSPPLSRSRFFFFLHFFLCSSTYAARFCTGKVASEGGEGMVQTEHLELSGKVIEEADVLYVTRIQKERFASEEVCP